MKNLVIASLLGLLSVALGAFGAHALKDVLDPAALINYETAVRYMMIHALVLLFLNNSSILEKNRVNTLSYLFISGIFLFSGSILAISLGAVDSGSIWLVTPLGGLLLISGWLGMAVSFARLKKTDKKGE